MFRHLSGTADTRINPRAANRVLFMKQPRTDHILWTLAGLAVLAGLVAFWPFASMVIVGASVAILLLPVHHRLSRSVRPWLSAAMLTAGVCCVLLAIIASTFFIFSKNSAPLMVMMDTIRSWLADPSANPLVAVDRNISSTTASFFRSQFVYWLSVAREFFVDFGSTIVLNGTRIAIQALLFFISVFLLLLCGEKLKEWVFLRVPFLSVRKHDARISAVTFDTLHVIYVAQFAIAVLTFFISLPVFWLLGYGNILFYSFLAAFCELIPVFGSTVAFIIVGAYALAQGDLPGVFILFFLGYVGVAALPEIFIRPVLMGRRVHVHPVVMFTGFIGGIVTMGIAGFVLGPLILVLLITCYRIYREEKSGTADSPG